MILPFRFARISSERFLITNEVGDYLLLNESEMWQLARNEITDQSLENKLASIWVYCEESNLPWIKDILALRYRTKKAFLLDFTGLHMVIPTLFCNSKCIYCQVTSQRYDQGNMYSMDFKTAKKAVDMIFKSPSQYIKIEFQGGEPTLNFEIVKYIVKYAEMKNKIEKKELEFVICTNLLNISITQLEFLHDHKVAISTSLDGPKHLHDFNRAMHGDESSYDLFCKNLKLAKSIYSDGGINALMTTTRESFKYGKAIVDEYIELGFNSIFLRELNPYGVAQKNIDSIGYRIEEFLDFYQMMFEYIIDLNIAGTNFIEDYAALLLRRICSPFSTGFVDLQSPAGIGISCAIYNYNGKVYVSDEGRMLGETGDDYFYIGSFLKDNHDKIFKNPKLISNIEKGGILEGMSGCSTCAYLPYCGVDPVRNYTERGSSHLSNYGSSTCKKNKYIFDMLFRYLAENESKIVNVFESWSIFQR